MKKIYALAFAGIAAASAAAGNIHPLVSAERAEVSKIQTRTAVQTSKPAKLPASAYESYTWVLLGDGKYQASTLAAMYQGSTQPVDVKVYEAEGHAGVYKAVGVWPDFLKDGELIVDASNAQFVTVPKQDTGVTDNVDGKTYIASQSWVLQDEKGYTPDQIIAGVPELIPTLKDGLITFPQKSLVLNWPEAPADSKYGTDSTAWYTAKDNGGYLLLPGGTYVDPWKEVGTASVTGDLLFAAFGKTQSDYTAKVYQSTSDENIYRIENPLAGLYKALGATATSPEWEIDATVANNISLEPTTTGINGGDTDGIYYLMTANQNYEAIDQCPEERRASLVKTEEATTFTFPQKSLFLWPNKTENLYIACTTDVLFTIKNSGSGVSTVVSEPAAQAEYFNLQGQRVENPAAGQIVIKRQGSSVSKIVVK